MNRITAVAQAKRFKFPGHGNAHQDLPGEFDRHTHFRRSLMMTLITLAIGFALFGLFFGLVAAADRM